MTEPVIHSKYFYVKAILKRLYKILRSYFYRPLKSLISRRITGHYGVTRSLLSGLNKNKWWYLYNPITTLKLPGNCDVIVLAGLDTLESAIELKKSGKAKRIFAGPNIVVFGHELTQVQIDVVDAIIVPSEFVKNLYLEDLGEEWRRKVIIWPAGVDIDYWSNGKPDNKHDLNNVIVYSKQIKGATEPIQKYVHLLQKYGYQVSVVDYGNYSLHEYQHLLSRCSFMVGFVRVESQGLAWAEAWATDTYTLIWQNDYQELNGRTYASQTAPYLNKKNGSYFTDIHEFEQLIRNIKVIQSQAEPLSWCRQNMSDSVCARDLINKVQHFT